MCYTLQELIADYEDSGHALDTAMAITIGFDGNAVSKQPLLEYKNMGRDALPGMGMETLLIKHQSTFHEAVAEINKLCDQALKTASCLANSSKHDSNFETLPLEIRNRIYGFFLPVFGTRLFAVNAKSKNCMHLFPNGQMAVSLVSRRMRQEYLTLLAARCVISFTHDDIAKASLTLDRLPPVMLSQVKNFELWYQPLTPFSKVKVDDLTLRLKQVEKIVQFKMYVPCDWLKEGDFWIWLFALPLEVKGGLGKVLITTTERLPEGGNGDDVDWGIDLVRVGIMSGDNGRMTWEDDNKPSVLNRFVSRR